FFFSSRRRHTRSKRDWSSDVCSSDLGRVAGAAAHGAALTAGEAALPAADGGKEAAGRVDGAAAHRGVQAGDLVGEARYQPAATRSEERRVGKECRSRWWGSGEKKKGS